MRKPSARIKFSRNFGSAAPGRALASTWQSQLPVRDCQKRCIAETLFQLSGTSLQKNQAKSKEPPWESLNHRNYRAGYALECPNHMNYRAATSPTTRRDLAHPSPPSGCEPCAFRSAKCFACQHFGDRSSRTPLLPQAIAYGYVSNTAIAAG